MMSVGFEASDPLCFSKTRQPRVSAVCESARASPRPPVCARLWCRSITVSVPHPTARAPRQVLGLESMLDILATSQECKEWVI